MKSKRIGFNRWRRPALLATLLIVGVFAIGIALAQLGTVLTSFQPAPAGNGRAVAHDPATGHLFFTNSGDPNIYVVTTNNIPVATLTPGINFGALSWDAKRGVLWGGAYDGTGNVYTITPAGVATFKFTFTTTDSCYGTFADKFYDGVAYDEGPTLADSDDSLWLSGDNAKTLYHVDLSGNLIGSSAIPNNRCNTGIAADGKYLWLALQSGPDAPPHDIVRVDKANPTVVLSIFPFSATNPGPEDIELDVTTFPGKCALWSNQFGTTTIKAWELEQGIKPECGKPSKVVGGGRIGPRADPEKKITIWAYSELLPNGVVEVEDLKNTLTIKSTAITSVTTILSTPKTGTIKGNATVNGAGPYPFIVDVIDANNPSNNLDVFQISIPAIGYLNKGNVSIGDITVVK